MDMMNKFTEIGELLVEDAEAGAAAHIEAVEEVRDPLDAPRDQLDVLPVYPVRLSLSLKTLPVCLSCRKRHFVRISNLQKKQIFL